MRLKIKYFFAFYLFFSLVACNGQDHIEKSNNEDENFKIEQLNDTVFENKSFYPNGQLKEVSFYNNNKQLDGKSTEWYENGKKKLEWRYYKGTKHGKQVTWSESGSVLTEGNYYFGNLHGKQIRYNSNSELLSEENYNLGKLVTRQVPKDYYKPPEIMMQSLLNNGIDSLTAIKMLKGNLSGYIVQSEKGAIFIEDTLVYGIIGGILNEADSIRHTKMGTPITYDYLISKGLSNKQIKDLVKQGYIKLDNGDQER